MASEPNRVFDLLNQQPSTVQSLLRRAALLAEMQTQIRELLQSPWSSGISVANLRGDTLVLFAPNSASLTQLRFSAPQILEHIQENFGFPLRQLDARVKPESPIRR